MLLLQQIPRDGKHLEIEIDATTLEEAQAYLMASDLPKDTRWVVVDPNAKLTCAKGKPLKYPKVLGEGISVDLYYYDNVNDEISSRKFNYIPKGSNHYFITKEEAEVAANLVKERRRVASIEAEKLLDDYEKQFRALPFGVGYFMDGDTHGIHTEYLYISVIVDGFYFERVIG
jgi:hypothetical protein